MAMAQQGPLISIAESDTFALAQKAVSDGPIKEDVLDHLTSLHPQVPSSMKHRYLLACFRASIAIPVQKSQLRTNT